MSDASPQTILLCEDEEMLLDLVAGILEDKGMTVIKTSSSMHALELYKTHPKIDLVITDYKMPEMNGKQLGQELEKINPNVKIIYASGNAEGTAGQNGFVKNAKFLGKPYNRKNLLATIASFF